MSRSDLLKLLEAVESHENASRISGLSPTNLDALLWKKARSIREKLEAQEKAERNEEAAYLGGAFEQGRSHGGNN